MKQKLAKMDGPLTIDTQQICSVDGCDAHANRISAKMCEKHYMRQRRRGTTEKYKRKPEIRHSHGYILLADDEHPLSKGMPSGSRIYKHRAVFYDAYGGGDHVCHWCGKGIHFNDMHVDHVNAVRNDNRLENLVAACPSCNRQRGTDRMRSTMRSKGIMITHNGQTKHISEWAEDIGITSVSLKYRLKSGWALEDALTKPRGKTGPRRKA